MNKLFTKILHGDVLELREATKMAQAASIGDPLVFVKRVDPYFEVAEHIRANIVKEAVHDENEMISMYGRIVDTSVNASVTFWNVSYRPTLIELKEAGESFSAIAVESVVSVMYAIRWFALMASNLMDLDEEDADIQMALAMYHTALSRWEGNDNEIALIKERIKVAEKTGNYRITVGGYTVYTQ